MAAGRPSDYSDEVCRKARLYLSSYEEQGDAIPSVAGLSVFLKIARSTIYEWAKDDGKSEFSDILQEILAKQETVLISKGLTGAFNATITKVILGKHGYSDKVEAQHTGPDGGPMAMQVSVVIVDPNDPESL